MEKLPIKFFVAREEDNLRVEGFGPQKTPNWLLPDDKIIEQSVHLCSQMESLNSLVIKRELEASKVPVVGVVKIKKDATAKSKRSYITNILNDKDAQNVIGFQGETDIIFMVSSKNCTSIRNKLKNTNENKQALSCIEDIVPFEQFEEYDSNCKDYKIKLIDFHNYEVNKSMQRIFEASLNKSNIVFDKTLYFNNLPIYKLSNLSKVQLDSIRKEDSYNSIFSISPMPKFELRCDSIDCIEEKFDGTVPEAGKDYEIVGVLDNGIARIPQLVPWMYGDRWSPYTDDDLAKDHGTFVAGIIVYGDLLEGKDWVGHKGVRVFDAAVLPDLSKETIDEDELISNIQRVIKKYHNEIKIWSLSISISREIQDDKFSDFAIALDSLQDAYNIIICKSAGNTTEPLYLRPKERINEGADSVRSLVVGSVAHEQSVYDLEPVGNPSPFSRMGPGPQFIIKPEVSHYGGNAGIDGSGTFCISGVKSLNIKGQTATSVGTSFSTPRVASLVAGLCERIDESFDPLLLKALIIHNAKYPIGLTVPEYDRTKYMGFGVPTDIEQIIYNKNNEATLILRDSLSKGEYIDILDFPMPECLVKDGYYTGQITVTIVYDPVLDATQGAEYCQSNVDILFGSYDIKSARDTSKPNILNPIGRDGSQNVLSPTLYSKRMRKNNTGDFALMERLLIQYGDKYYPVKKYAIDLSEMTETNKVHFLGEDKKWYLQIKGLYRENCEKQSKQTGELLSQEFCAIVSVKGDDYMPVYDNVTQKLDYYNFIHSNIKLANEIKIDNSNLDLGGDKDEE